MTTPRLFVSVRKDVKPLEYVYVVVIVPVPLLSSTVCEFYVSCDSNRRLVQSFGWWLTVVAFWAYAAAMKGAAMRIEERMLTELLLSCSG